MSSTRGDVTGGDAPAKQCKKRRRLYRAMIGFVPCDSFDSRVLERKTGCVQDSTSPSLPVCILRHGAHLFVRLLCELASLRRGQQAIQACSVLRHQLCRLKLQLCDDGHDRMETAVIQGGLAMAVFCKCWRLSVFLREAAAVFRGGRLR